MAGGMHHLVPADNGHRHTRQPGRGTVKTHIGRLMAKLAARDRAQLVITGYEAGLADR